MEKRNRSRYDSTYDSLYPHLNEVDRFILQLNHEGLTGPTISKILFEHGIELVKVTVNRHLTELRQDPANNVRINVKRTNKKPKAEKKWYKIIQKLKEAISEYTKLTGFKPSSRTMFYQFVDDKIIDKKDHGYFVTASRVARLGWIDSTGEPTYPKLDLDCFAEDDSRITVNNYDDEAPKEMVPPTESDYEEYIEDTIAQTRDAINDYRGVGDYGEDARRGGRWYNQPEYVEVWEEKNDLVDGFETILRSRKINIRGNKGFSSLDFLRQCVGELKELIDATGLQPEHIHIKWCGDCDPSGLAIDYYIQKRLRHLGIAGIDFQRVAVKYEHIKKYNLTVLPIKQVDPEKKDDTNLKEYMRLYGDKATHLNAFFTKKHLSTFKKMLLKEVDRHWDKSIYEKMVNDYSEEAPLPDSYTDESLKEIRKELREELIKALEEDQKKEDSEQ